MRVPRVEVDNLSVDVVTEVMDNAGVPSHIIDTVNWKEYPYVPDVKFRIAHTGDAILLNYRVNEEAVRAVAEDDNGRVWEDSCVEFFVTFDGKQYHNIECNCVGTILSAVGPERENRKLLAAEQLDKIKRKSTLDKDSIPVNGPVEWEVSLIIPVEIFAASGGDSFDGIEARGNFYKCGDLLPTPHFLSWNPIEIPAPNFHRPDYFGKIIFE
ncbi:MAG: hypothetical protein K2G40_01090 [Muribaculaceae bacterium]|nr:hypothetical protein [Muribaculaceae bacterium]